MRIVFVVVLAMATVALAANKQAAPHPMTWFRYPNVFNALHQPLKDVEEQWFDQLVDHFNPNDKTTWKQLFYVNDQWFNGTGPVFFYFNGEGPLSPSAVTSDYFVTELAEQFGALLVSHEHRYYGQSFPVSDMSVDNMRFLTVEQALEDAAYFQTSLTESMGLESNQWVIMGGSYSGFLTTAYRIRYPHLVVAGYSSSGVVQPIVDYYQYFEVIDQDYSWYPNCYDAILNVSESIQQLWDEGVSGLAELTEMFGLCSPLTESDEQDFWATVNGPSAGAAQYGYTKDLCAWVLGSPTPLQGWSVMFRGFGSKFAGIDWESSCVDIDWKDVYANTTLYIPYTGARTWFWQVCTEFGWFQTTETSKLWPQNIDVDYYFDGCDVMFEEGLRPNPDQIVMDYGGVKPEGNQIVSCAGLADPWHPACQLSTYKDTEPVNFIEAQDASHCKDMDAPTDDDSDELKNARASVLSYLTEWLS